MLLFTCRGGARPARCAPALLSLNFPACYALIQMSDAIKKRSNSALWLGLLITVLGVLSNLLYFLQGSSGRAPVAKPDAAGDRLDISAD